MYALTPAEFERWLNGYKVAWEKRDPEAAAALFTADAQYFWTPFDPPQTGRAQIATVWQAAVSGQKDIAFDFEVFAVAGPRGCARWHVRLESVPQGEPVEMDGIVIAEFAAPNQCRTFREWWHLRGKT
jgi:ketosteroid isomerase-like protein